MKNLDASQNLDRSQPRRRLVRALGVPLLAGVMVPAMAMAQTTQPLPTVAHATASTMPTTAPASIAGSLAAPVSAVEAPVADDVIRRDPKPANSGGATTQTSMISTFSSGSAGRVIIALAVVLVLIACLKLGAGKFLGIRSAGPKSNRGVRVLSRTLMGHKQQLVLLQVGRKLVLVSDSAGTVSPLTEITDPDEVAELAAQAVGGNTTSTPFVSQIRKQSSSYDEIGSDDDQARLPAAEPQEQGKNVNLSGLADKVRLINRQFN